MALLWEALETSADADLAAIAAKSLKEARYHLRHSRDWLVRLGDGTDESHARAQAAVDHLLPYTQEFWADSPAESAAIAAGVGADPGALKADWDAIVDAALAEATLQRPAIWRLRSRGQAGHPLRASRLPARRDAEPRPRPPERCLVSR
jgi:ring-1,2-phenylacetyl-CoA epoxidase subunit PaaC